MLYFERAIKRKQKDECFYVRKKVFCEEQNIPENIEFDGLDGECIHYIVYDLLDDGEKKPIATLRVHFIKPRTCIIQRVCVLKEYRHYHIGTTLLIFIEKELNELHAKYLILNAQTHAISFYQRIGYEIDGKEFLEADIPHVKMIKQLYKNKKEVKLK